MRERSTKKSGIYDILKPGQLRHSETLHSLEYEGSDVEASSEG